MNNGRLDALSARTDKDGKSWFTRIGVAFPTKDGLGYTVYLDAMPPGTDGQFKIMLKPPQEKDGGQQQSRSGGSGRVGRDDSDSIPFMMEWR